MITADGDDTSTFDQQPRIWTRNNAELTVESLFDPTPADSSAGGRSELCEQLIESRDVSSCSPVSFKPSSIPVVTAAADLGSPSSIHVADAAPSETMPDAASASSPM